MESEGCVIVMRVETRTDPPTETPSATRMVSYSALSGVAVLTSLGIWLLMIVDEGRTVGAATFEMVVKFTNVTTLLVALVAAWIASSRSLGSVGGVAHLTAMVMSVVTAVVNVTLLDATLPDGWWGVIDLLQHYLIPATVVVTWAMLGPRLGISGSRLGGILLAPLGWLVLVLIRGAATGNYPYDFLDVVERGWPSVLATVAAMLALMLALGGAAVAADHRR